ncbi:MAG: hypothetical protein JKY55_06640 [Aliivibrio sp.]|uniref:hypothetical protein n=1 Tax=Aliivibrio sp. TaxID=1872443 RepID=UPI001A563BEE|nr:hypothetical protein [Aliivibrio sp.]
MIKKVAVVGLSVLLAACSNSVDEKADDFMDVSFNLCATKVKSFSKGDDGIIRTVCEDGSYFQVKNQETIEVMQEINGAYCNGVGFSSFNERKKYYTFTCKNDRSFNIAK